MFARLKSLIRNFVADRAGNVVLIVAFSAIPLVGMVGFATDYGLMLAVKAKLDHAADAAAIAGITGAQNYITSGTGSSTPAAITAGEAQALAQFNANTGTLPNGTLTITSMTVSASGRTLTGNAGYSYSMPTVFMQVLGKKTVTLTGTSSTSLTLPGYTNIYVVIDISSSMGIGATATDQQIVYTATGGCAVACHYDTSETAAHNAHATLRIDVAKTALQSALQQISASTQSAQFKVAIYTMSDKLVHVYPTTGGNASTGSLSGAILEPNSPVDKIDLSNANDDGGTDSSYALSTLKSWLPTPGNGLTAATAQGTIILITDGVQDSDMKYSAQGSYSDESDPNFSVYSPCVTATCWLDPNFGIYFEAFDPANCTSLKQLGYKMMTLNVQYLVPPTNLQGSSVPLQQAFTYIKTNLLNSIPTNMSACATSSSNAYSANTPAEIQSAVSQMFTNAGAQARITQ
jgi:Flp pilus assembly protein TadG